MNTNFLITAVMRRLICLLLVISFAPALMRAEFVDYPLGPIGGTYRIAGGSSAARIMAVTVGEPGALAGLQVGDYIYGAFGQTFNPTGNYHYGVSQELGFAVDRAEGGNGNLPLLVLRPGIGGMTINVVLPAAGSFGVAYPRSSAKYAAVYENAVAYLHSGAMATNGGLGHPTGWIGLVLLGHPNWNDTTGAKPYRLSINKIRDVAVSAINSWVYAATENVLLDLTNNPNYQGNVSDNWSLGQYVMFLAEYYARTGDASVAATLQRGTELCANAVQWWRQPGSPQFDYNRVAGMVGHNGTLYEYRTWFAGINMTGVHNFSGIAFARRAGMDMNARPKDGHYFGYTLNQGDPIPPAINALPASITLPQYGEDPVRGATITDPFWYDPSVHQKFTMQLNFIARRSGTYNGGNDDGAVRYAPDVGEVWDSGGRTPGTVIGMAMYQQDVGGLDSADLDRLERMKGFMTRNYMRHQEAHAYCVGAQAFQALATPYLSDRQQRFFMDNWRFYFALSRTSTNGFQYFPSRSVADNYQNLTDCAAVDYALPYGIANGAYSLVPGYNTNRTLANFKSPVLMWPSIDARTATVTSSTQAFQVDACDGNGAVLAPANYTATWSHISGPATATFSPSNATNTTVTFPTVSAVPYRIRLTISRAGVPDLTEDIDITRGNAPAPVVPSITAQPVAQSTVLGASASVSVTVAGTGPFVYQWRLNGVAYWGSSTSPTLTLTNIGTGHFGSYDCVITSPSGTLISNAVALTPAHTVARITGGLRREVWTALYGSSVADLTNLASYPLFPAVTAVVNSSEGPQDHVNYGQKISGWLRPPVSGQYRFFLSSNGGSELWLSTDETAANRVRIISHPSASGYRSYDLASADISLVAGQKYYIEILHKQYGSGGNHVSVTWQMPAEAVPLGGAAPIGGIYLESEQYLPLLTNHWKLDEASGFSCVDSVGTSPATLFNNPTRVAGKMGDGVTFNGVNQYAKATVNVSETVSAVSLWFRTTQSGGGLFTVIDESTSFDRSIYLNGGNIYATIWNTETVSSTGKNYGDGQWHHVVHTFGGAIGGQKLYVDGEQVAAGAKSQSDFNWQTAIKIGYTGHSPAPYFSGTIDDVRVYNAALSEQNAIALHDAGMNAAPVASNATFAVAENSTNGTSVGTVLATDANIGQVLSYSIVGGNVGNRFAIHSGSGAITVNGHLDFEGLSSFLLNVRVTDNGVPVASADAVLTINVTNVNDAPSFVSNPMRGPSTPAATSCSGHLTATDADSGSSLSFAKISGPSWLSVAADGTLSGTPSMGDIGLNSFVVRVTDNASAWSEVTLEILVVDLAVHPMWINPTGGSWPVAGNWMAGTIANGASIIADFSAPDLTGNATVTLDGSRTIGGLIFGDTENQFGWALNPGTGGTLTLNATGGPIIEVFNQTATLGLPIAGTQGFSKKGTGLLSLTAANTYTGVTAVNAGTLRIGNGANVGSINAASPVTIAAGAAAMWWHNTSITIANPMSGSGQLVIQGTNASNALQQSVYFFTGNNSSLTGELVLNRATTWNITSANQVGSGTIRVQDRGTFAVNGGATIANTIKIENGAGWHHNVSNNDVVIGAIRMEGTNTFTGNLQLNHNTGVALGDGTGAYSSLGSYGTANNTFSGVISGTGELSISRYTSWNGGNGQTVNIDLTGTNSNTFTGKTVVDGQYGLASLRLMKTGGAVAIPGGNVVQLGSDTAGAANLRAGDAAATGAARNQWNNQFGVNNGGVTLNFVNASGQWMRFDLQGTQQSVAGLNAGDELTAGGAMVQNQNFQSFDPGQDATLTLIGSGVCFYNGYLRDQDNGGTTRKLHLVKSGTGIQTLAGTALTYTGTTTINGGALRINGTLGNTATTINSGGRLEGTGTLNGVVALNAGATIAAGGDAVGTLTFANTVSLHNSGTVALRLDKIGSVLSNDKLVLSGASALVCKGTLAVTFAPESEPLANGDTFTLFSATGEISGSFATLSLPTLPPLLQWNTDDLYAAGKIKVVSIEQSVAPVFSLASGGYVGAQSITISTPTVGATIRYTTDGSDPVTSGTAISGLAPISGVNIPAPANVTINAYAFKAGAVDSPVATATYGTVTSSGITWTNPSGGAWSTSSNWLNGAIANGSGLIPKFDTLSLSGNATVTLSGTITVGGLTFADAGNLYSWTLAGSTLMLAGTSTPAITVQNQPAYIGAVLAGSQGFAKSGSGILALSGANTYTGTTIVNQGMLQIGLGTNVGSLNAGASVAIASGATAMWWHNSSGVVTVGNAMSGSGQWVLQGTNATNALHQSQYTPTGNNSGFTGALILNRAALWGITNANQIGAGTVRIQDRGMLAVNGGATIPNVISVENGAGWHHNVSGDVVIGAIRMEGANTFTGNLQLNQTTGVILGDGTGANSTFGSWSAANNTFSGVISGAGELSMSRYTSWNGGTTQFVDINIAGAASNTFTGKTVIDGQGAKASLRLMKSGGAIAIPGGNVVQLGSNTGGQGNLRMGDTIATGAARNQWDNQFGTASGGVLLNYVNPSGHWMRFDLQGTQQSVAGLNAGTSTTQAGAVVQNQSFQSFDPGQNATLTLIGSSSYLYNGIIRDQDNAGTTRKLNLVKSGSGIQTLVGSAISYTGSTTVSGGTLRLQDTTGTVSALSINAAGTLELNRTANGFASRGKLTGLISGTGTINVNNATAGIGGGWTTFNGASSGFSGFTGTVNVNSGVLSMDSLAGAWSGNPDLNLSAGGLFAIRGQDVSVDALTGNGDVFNSNTNGGAAGKTLTIGATGGSGIFSGVIHGTVGIGGTDGTIEQGILNLTKAGAGTQTLTGINTYTGTTTVNAGTLLIHGSLANTATTVAAAGTLGGTGTINGAVTVNGTLAPGGGGIGTLTATKTLALAGVAAMDVSKISTSLVADKVSGMTTVIYGGSLVVTKRGTGTLAAGDGFTLFTATSYSGTFSNLSLPALGTGLEWNTSQLTVNGTIAVQAMPLDGDPDGDGFTTGLELSLGTDPGSAASQPGTLYSSLRAWWRLDETSGTIANDTTGRLQDGTLVNAPAWSTGLTGGAVTLNGTSQSIQIPPLNLNANTVTISAWVKRNGSQPDKAGLVFTAGASASGLRLGPSNDLRYSWNGDVNTANFSSGLTIPDNTWTFCAVVIEPTKATLYLQPAGGAMQSAVNTLAHAAAPFSGYLHLGRDADDTLRYFKGSLDEVHVYTRSLSASAIDELYESANAPSAPAFINDPIARAGATEDVAYSGTLAASATDVDAGDSLTYSKISGPAWLNVASNGVLSGTPANSDAGANAFVVRVTDSTDLTDDAALNISVANVNDAPTFTSNPLIRPDASVGIAYTGSIAADASDIDADDTRTFSKVSGPAWLAVAANGTLSGTPPSGSGGLNSFVVRVTDSGVLSSDTTLNISVAGTLPSGWAGGDIGTVGLPGSASFNGSAYTVSGSGADIWGAADAFQFASQTLVGDGEIRARVTSLSNPGSAPKAGVMIRSGTSAGAVNAMATVTASGFHFQYRATASGASSATSGPILNPAPNNWLRVTRSGSILTGYYSANGTNWMQMGTATISMASSVSMGLAVCSKDNGTLSAATFDNVAVTPFPAPWITADLGTTGLAGSAEFFGSAYTVKGAGTFGGSTDGFRYVYQTLSGDGSIVARVNTLQDTGTSSRVGVMIRDTLTNNSRMAALTVSGTGTWRWQRRTSTGGSVSTTNSSSGTSPNLWVRLVRSGSTVTASRSTNGTTWTTISSVSIPMAANCYIGLSVASGSTTTLNTSVMDGVTVVP